MACDMASRTALSCARFICLPGVQLCSVACGDEGPVALVGVAQHAALDVSGLEYMHWIVVTCESERLVFVTGVWSAHCCSRFMRVRTWAWAEPLRTGPRPAEPERDSVHSRQEAKPPSRSSSNGTRSDHTSIERGHHFCRSRFRRTARCLVTRSPRTRGAWSSLQYSATRSTVLRAARSSSADRRSAETVVRIAEPTEHDVSRRDDAPARRRELKDHKHLGRVVRSPVRWPGSP